MALGLRRRSPGVLCLPRCHPPWMQRRIRTCQWRSEVCASRNRRLVRGWFTPSSRQNHCWQTVPAQPWMVPQVARIVDGTDSRIAEPQQSGGRPHRSLDSNKERQGGGTGGSVSSTAESSVTGGTVAVDGGRIGAAADRASWRKHIAPAWFGRGHVHGWLTGSGGAMGSGGGKSNWRAVGKWRNPLLQWKDRHWRKHQQWRNHCFRRNKLTGGASSESAESIASGEATGTGGNGTVGCPYARSHIAIRQLPYSVP